MGRALRTYVHVHDEDGQTHVFGPDDEVPAWAAKRITNPAAWEDDAGEDTGGQQAGGEQTGAPPRSGKGSGKEAWAAYAAQHDVKLENDATREDYIAELERRGVISPGE